MPLLDDLTATPEVAVSLSRYLRTAFTGAVVRLREDATSVEADFKLNGSNVLVLDSDGTTTVSSWLTTYSASNAYIAKWYDQSTSANDFVQATAASQPLLVESGIDGKACAKALRASTSFMAVTTAFNPPATASAFGVMTVTENNSLNTGLMSAPNTSTFRVGIVGSLGGYTFQADSGQIVTAGTNAVDTPEVVGFVTDQSTGSNPTQCKIRDNGEEVADSSLNIDLRNYNYRFGMYGTQGPSDSLFAEILWDSIGVSDTDIDTIEDSMAAQFGITLFSAAAGIAPLRRRIMMRDRA